MTLEDAGRKLRDAVTKSFQAAGDLADALVAATREATVEGLRAGGDMASETTRVVGEAVEQGMRAAGAGGTADLASATRAIVGGSLRGVTEVSAVSVEVVGAARDLGQSTQETASGAAAGAMEGARDLGEGSAEEVRMAVEDRLRAMEVEVEIPEVGWLGAEGPDATGEPRAAVEAGEHGARRAPPASRPRAGRPRERPPREGVEPGEASRRRPGE